MKTALAVWRVGLATFGLVLPFSWKSYTPSRTVNFVKIVKQRFHEIHEIHGSLAYI
jgi:hypothetical protein